MEKWQDPQTIAPWIVIVILLIFLLVFSIIKLVYTGFKRMVENQLKESKMQLGHQKKLQETNIIVQENERRRFAADLHDTLIGKLTVLRIRNQLVHDQSETDRLLNDCIEEARRISHDLSPPMLEHTSFHELIYGLIAPWEKNTAIAFRQDIRSEVDFPVRSKIQLTRIFQELMTNISKHAGATHISIQLRQTDLWLILLVHDNGCGFDSEKEAKGLGMQNIQLRMQYLEGFYRFKSRKDKGTTALFLFQQSKIQST